MAGHSRALPRQLRWAGYGLGFALGGFFDGILLHQVLQWHHLLSAVEDGALRDLRAQVLADGLFHALMYGIAAVSLVLLWRSRRRCSEPGGGRLLPAAALTGFGVWHMVDGVLSHWVLGIHRIRMDVADPLPWDLAWFLVFGVAFVLAGWWLARQAGPGGGGPRAMVAPVLLALAVGAGAPLAALPPRDATAAVVVFRPGVTPSQALDALAANGGRILWSDRSGQVWAMEGATDGGIGLYRRGALLVGNGFLPAGCLDWSRPPTAQTGHSSTISGGDTTATITDSGRPRRE